ncbi:MAG: SDR family oxidoreductase [Myxococcales bacterium]|nr:MAG: SDR family oxidoreductase [Myxococcales bacterium]
MTARDGGAWARRYGPWALVTGASSGIGQEFARQLAARGLHVALVARRRDRLDALAGELRSAHGVEARVLALDLSRLADVEAVAPAVADLEVGLLVNNAGFGEKGLFLETPLARHLEMLAVNARAPLALAHALAGPMVARGRGGVIFTSSTAAFQPTPYTAHYAATKGYELQLAEALWHELAPAGVDVLALCPGATDTEGPARTGVDPARVPVRPMPVAPVVRTALDRLGHAPVAIPGLVNRLGALATRLLPRTTAARLAGRLIRRSIGS